MIIDSHAHLSGRDYQHDLDQVLRRAREAGLVAVIDIGYGAASRACETREEGDWPRVYTTVGCHPHGASRLDGTRLEEMRHACREEEVVAVGEIGLDFYRNLSPREVQLEAFRRQLDLAAEERLPVVVHSRQASEETFAILAAWSEGHSDAEKEAGGLGVIHCFSGDLPLAWGYIGLGFCISIAGPVTYPGNEGLREVAEGVPLNRLLVETDSPYLAPVPHRGRRNEPVYVVHTIEEIARCRGMEPSEVAEAAAQNTVRLFKLKDTLSPC